MSRFVSMAAVGLTALGINLGTAGRSEAQAPFGLQFSVARGPFAAGINFGYPGCIPSPGPAVFGPTAPIFGGPVAACPPTTVLRPQVPVFVNPGPNYWSPYYRHYHRRPAFYGPGAYGW